MVSTEESDENNMWFGYDIQNTCVSDLGFHWVSKLMHMTNLAIFYWLSNLCIINEFEKELKKIMNFKNIRLSLSRHHQKKAALHCSAESVFIKEHKIWSSVQHPQGEEL